MTVATGFSLVRNSAVTVGPSTNAALYSTTTDAWAAHQVASFVSYPGTLLRGTTQTAAEALAATTSTAFLKVGVPVDDKTAFLITWAASATSTGCLLTVYAGEDRRAWQEGQGVYQLGLISTDNDVGRQYIIGPFETARFGRVSCSTSGGWAAGSSDIGLGKTFLLFHLQSSAAGTATDQWTHVGILPFRLPTVSYST
jgi:hypothetical protein